MAGQRKINIEFPLGGLHRKHAMQKQPPYTTPDCLNVWPRCALASRERGGSRPGLSRQIETQLGGAYPVRLINNVRVVAGNGFTYWCDSFEGESLGEAWVGCPWIGSVTLTSVARTSNIATIVTASAHGFLPGQWITMSAAATAFNGNVKILTTPTTTSFTYANDGANAGAAADAGTVVPLPGVIGDTAASVTANQNQGAVRTVLTGFVTASEYEIGVLIVPYEGAHQGTYQLFAKLNDTTPNPGTVGVTVTLTLTAAGVASGSVRCLGTGGEQDQTVVFVVTSVPLGVRAGWLRVNIQGNVCVVTWLGVQVATITQAMTGAGTRVGFAMNCTAYGNRCLIDQFLIQFYGGDNTQYRSCLVALSNGSIYRETMAGTMAAPTHNVKFNTDRPLQSVQRGNILYVADWGKQISTGSGVIDAAHILTAAGVNWGTLGLTSSNIDEYVAVITGPASNVVAGTWTITAVSGASLTLAAGVGGGAALNTCTYRVERAPKRYYPLNDIAVSGTIVDLWTATVGKGEVPTGCPHIGLFNDSLLVSGGVHAPHVWYMSRQGDGDDWDYSKRDAGAAACGLNSKAGQIGQPITCQAVFEDEWVVFGGVSTMWIMRGDPRRGGTIKNLSRTAGIAGGFAYCFTPEGHMVTMARDGLYVVPAGGGEPEPLSRNILPREMMDVDPIIYDVFLAFDITYRGVFILMVSKDKAFSRHWFFDWEGKRFWPMSFDQDHEGFLYRYDAEMGDSNTLILGGRDGYLRRFRDCNETDESAEIASYAYLGPIRVGGADWKDGLVTELQGTLAKGSGPVAWSLHRGDTAEDAAAASAAASGSWTAGFNYMTHPRVRGAWQYLKLANSGRRTWAMEAAWMNLLDAGMLRKL